MALQNGDSGAVARDFINGLETTGNENLQVLDGGIGAIAAMLGQVSGQVNGGRAELAGGTLDDPALKIGDVAIYSSASNTLSVGIAGVEVARFAAAGVTVFGTVTETP